MNPLRSACCLLLLLCNLSTLQAAEDALLWKFTPGDAHQYRMVQIMDMKMTLGAADKTIETSVEQTMDMTWKVDQIDEQGHAKVIQSMDRIQMDMQAPGQQKMHYDTNSEEAPTGFAAMMAPLFKAMTTEPFTMTMSTRGEIEELEMPKAFLKAIESIPGAAMMGEMFSDEGFKMMIQKNSLILPEPKDLTPGHQWTSKSEMKNAQLGAITSEVTYRYLGPREVKGKTLEAFGISLEMGFGEGPGGVTVEITEQDSTGEIFFDREAGRLESSSIQTDMDMTISVAGQEMKQKMVQKMTFDRVELPASE